jgi:hypothetical protein
MRVREKVWTDEQKAMQSERMKARWAAGKMGHKRESQPAIMPKPVGKLQSVEIHVDWDSIPLTEAQRLFGLLRDTVNHAGKILNNRLMEPKTSPCGGSSGAGCGKLISDLEAKGSDASYTNSQGLIEKILLCSELCWNGYQRKRLDDKHKARMRA